MECIPVKTHIVRSGEDIIGVVRRYLGGIQRPGDIVTLSEKVVAITQGRALPISSISVGFWASILWRFVRKVPYGIGLRSPWSMQCAIDEVGAPRILLAAIIGGTTRLFGRRGDFYRIAGPQAAMIDAAHTAGIAEFYECVIKGPRNPDMVAQQLSDAIGAPVAIVDANDVFGCRVVGQSLGLDVALVEEAMQDNPAGQDAECTPIVVLREVSSRKEG